MTMNKAYNPTWFTYNELSQITPMPLAWDVTASGPQQLHHDRSADCAEVYAYLDSQSKNLSSWVSSKIWSIVDGPWKLSAFNSDGNSTFVPNPAYSGAASPPWPSSRRCRSPPRRAEYNVLQAACAGGGQKLDVGYLPTTDAPTKPANATVGTNPVTTSPSTRCTRGASTTSR